MRPFGVCPAAPFDACPADLLLTFFSPLLDDQQWEQQPLWHGYAIAVGMVMTALIQSICLHQYFHRVFKLGMQLRSSLINIIYRKSLILSNAGQWQWQHGILPVIHLHSPSFLFLPRSLSSSPLCPFPPPLPSPLPQPPTPNIARQASTTGEIVNLMAVDAQRFMDLTSYLHMLWSAPLQIALALFFLWQLMGAATFAGLGVMILMVPLNGVIAKTMRNYQKKLMGQKDQRIKLMNEVLNGIKVLKLYAWERPFANFVTDIRDKELDVLKGASYMGAVSSFSWSVAPFMVSLVTFITYTLMGNDLTAQKAFVSLSLFNLLRFPLAMLPMMITALVEASVSLKRIRNFLLLEETDPNNVIREPAALHRAPPAEGKNNAGVPALFIDRGKFAWSRTGGRTINDDEEDDGLASNKNKSGKGKKGGQSEKSPLLADDPLLTTTGSYDVVLSDINFRAMPKELVAVVGRVGSGKSSLIAALLGEMVRLNGSVVVPGRVAYVPQQAWIRNLTVRDNITFGKEFNELRYRTIIEACALEPDLQQLPGGDQTEIGEKGINLSGGQKQRVAVC